MKFKTLTIWFSLIFVYIVTANASTKPQINDPDIATIFKEDDAEGTMIISSLDKQFIYIFNLERTNTRLTPASTFKIANSIIALEEGIIKDQHEIIKWDGQKRFLDDWNKDQTLKTAFSHSTIWVYQEFAKKIGKEKYLKYFDLFNYGNRLVGDDVSTFWLAGGGDLKISPLEQIEFLRKIYQKQLPISAKTYDILQDIMLVENLSDYKIYSKTGAATKDWIGHGWYVGYLTKDDQVWFFATNILINGEKDLPKRKDITIKALKKKNII